jgi:uncharacterized protein (TIGR02217 family)
MALDGFHDVLFPPGISYGSQGGPGFLTRILVLGSGQEARNINWEKSRAKYNCGYNLRSQTELDEVRDFFYCRRGKAYSFPYKDWRDYSVTGQTIGAGDDNTKTFSLKKTYTDGVYAYDRFNILPVAASAKIYFDGVLQESGYTVDRETATVTFASAPAAGVAITADFEFHVPVRFDTDDLPQTIEPAGHGQTQNIPLVEDRIIT